FLALEAAKLASGGADRRAVTEALRKLVPKARLLCAIDTLTYLERGGRIGKARALLGSLLNFKPLVTLRDGEVVPLGRARGRPQMLDRLVEILRRDGPITRLAVLHGAAAAEGENLRARLAAEYPDLDVIVSDIGPVLATHTGPGVIGITYLTA
ncbi:MAG TPA: DegV family protein, partial [Candidatus Dormibacteraeota bacterium]|nr:DegV family protein [Candidatus Dormibacteraeota bacterium]